MEEQKAGKEISSLATPSSKQRNRFLVAFWAIIFWASTFFLAGHPFLFGLQYTIYIIPAYAVLFNCLRHYKIPVLPYQEYIICFYKNSFIYKLLYVNNAYEKGSKKELIFRQCRGMVYFHLLFAFIAFSVIFFDPIKNERKTFYEEGRIVFIEKIPTLSLCGNIILTIKNKKNKEIKLYSGIEFRKAILFDLSDVYDFEIDYAKKSPVYSCRKYNYLYVLRKNNKILSGIGNNLGGGQKIDKILIYSIVFFMLMAFIFIFSLCFSYRERNRV